jgi:tripartite-type tricarboxylate transporter receptor subunit TctC
MERVMRSSRRRSLLVASGAAALASVARPASAQAWPSKPIRLVEGYGAGSAPDIIARLIGQRLGERLGQPFVIDNKPGASGRIATDAVEDWPAGAGAVDRSFRDRSFRGNRRRA